MVQDMEEPMFWVQNGPHVLSPRYTLSICPRKAAGILETWELGEWQRAIRWWYVQLETGTLTITISSEKAM